MSDMLRNVHDMDVDIPMTTHFISDTIRSQPTGLGVPEHRFAGLWATALKQIVCTPSCPDTGTHVNVMFPSNVGHVPNCQQDTHTPLPTHVAPTPAHAVPGIGSLQVQVGVDVPLHDVDGDCSQNRVLLTHSNANLAEPPCTVVSRAPAGKRPIVKPRVTPCTVVDAVIWKGRTGKPT
jgi:hypothetical protein